MNKKLLLASLSALAVGAQGLFAQTPPAAAPAAPAISVTATAAAASQYMFRGMRLSGAAFQPAVEVAAGDLAVGAWSNFPFDGDKVPGSSDPEIDLYGSYTIKVNDQASFAPGFTSYHFPRADESAGWYKWTFEPNLAFNYTVEGFKLTPKVYYDFVLKGATFEFTGFYALPLKDIGSELDFTATYGTYKWKEFGNDVSPAIKAWGNYWILGVSMPFQIAPNQKLVLGFAYHEGRDAFTKQGNLGRAANTGAIGRGVASLSYSFTF